MKKIIFTAVLSAVLIISGCGRSAGPAGIKAQKSGDTAWKFEKTIAEPIKMQSTAGQDIALGSLEKEKVEVAVPRGTFDADTEVKLENPEKVPDYFGQVVDTIGAPIEISAGSPVRLNEPIKIRFKFDKSALPEGTVPSELRIAYFDGKEWEYIMPDAIDLEGGIASFTTFHFSMFGLNKIKDETKITEEWIHSKTLDSEMRKSINKLSDHVANQIIDMTLEKMGISDKSIKGKILGEILKEDDYKDIVEAAAKGEVVDMSQKIAVLSGKKIAELVPESVFQEGLKSLTDGGTEDVAAVAKAAGYAAEGQYKEAAKIIGEQIADKFLITTAGKVAVEVMNYQIDSWKNSEVEAAFVAYKNGADGYFWGYNADKGDFDAIWDQMRGIRRQLEIEAIAKQNAIRESAGLLPLSEKQAELVRAGVKDSYRKQFETRSKMEDTLAAEEQKMKLIVEGFKKAGFFDSAGAPTGLDKGFDLRGKLDVLGHFAQMIMNDTKRFEVSEKSGLIMTDKISIDDIVQGARYYFSGPEGKQAYYKFLKDRFNIDIYPELKELAGEWKGSMTITDVIIAEELKNQAKDKKNEDGCDFSIDLAELKGKSFPITLKLAPQGESGGSMVFSSEDGGDKSIPFTYSDGVVGASVSEKGAVGTLKLNAGKDAQAYALKGSMNINYEGGKVKIVASIGASKPVASQPVKIPAKTGDKK